METEVREEDCDRGGVAGRYKEKKQGNTLVVISIEWVWVWVWWGESDERRT